MGLMCTDCYEKQKNYQLESTEEHYHPYHIGNCKCGGIVCEIDDLCIDTIVLLNKKGWTTKFCCSGHLDSETLQTYIYFQNMPNSIPEGFVRDVDRDTIRVVDFLSKNLKGIEGFTELLEVNKVLYEWAYNLPEREKENDEL